MKLSKREKIVLVIIPVVALLIRFVFLNGKSGDYIGFLEPWVNTIRELGGFKALGHNIGNYNVPYVFLLTLVSYLKCEPLIPIKIISIIFDFICSVYAFKIVNKLTNKKSLSLICYIIILFLPTVVANGAMWGQCDSIYTSFILISLYYLLDKKYTKSFIFLGISFAFKLQFIFILPLYVLIFFREKDIHLYHFLIIPVVNIIMCLPAIIMGRNFLDVIMIYFNQANTYINLVLNFPNIYNLIQSNLNFFLKYYDIVCKIGIIITMFIYFCMWLYILIKKVKFNHEKILTVGLWCIVIATYFLPRMHDRYMFVADVLSVILFIIYQKKFAMMLTINLVSILSYFSYLFDLELISYNFVCIVYFILIIDFTIYVFKLLGDNNGRVGKNRLVFRKI